MVINRRKKSSRYRAKTTHGFGSMKKNRGYGNKGGKGMAGSGKRADTKKPSILKKYGKSYYGKHGFHRPQKMLHNEKTINIDYIDANLDRFVAKKLIENKSGIFIIDLKKLGYDKLLGKGVITNKYKVMNGVVSRIAVKKIEGKGGVVERNDADNK